MAVDTQENALQDWATSQVDRANASGNTPIVFVHGLWLLPSSWDRWATLFEDAGYVAVKAGWPDDPETVAQANAAPNVFAHKSVGQIAAHVQNLIRRLDRKPAIIGHSFGGLLTQTLAGRGLAAAWVAIDAAPSRGVLPLPISALRVAKVVIGNPRNYHRAVPLTYEQFRFGFANAVTENEAKQLYDDFSVAGSGVPLFQASTANLNPWTEAKVDTKNPKRGPMLIVSGELDHTVPPVLSKAAYKKQSRNDNITEFLEFEGRGHALTIDSGWREVAERTLGFVQRFV